MKTIFEPTKGMTSADTSYCPGCSHGIAHRIIMECLEERGLLGKTIGVVPIGCSINAHHFMNVDMCESTHGRAPAIASGIRRVHPDKIVFTYQGDGDLASIGAGEIVHAAHRGEKFTTFFINNAIYGMTGGQMAPTSLVGQVTQTSPYGRDPATQGMPIRICELLASLDAPAYLARVAVNSVPNVRKAGQAILKAFRNQVEGKGFSLVEVVSTCPTNWGLTPEKACQWVAEKMIPFYPLGVYRDKDADAAKEASK